MEHIEFKPFALTEEPILGINQALNEIGCNILFAKVANIEDEKIIVNLRIKVNPDILLLNFFTVLKLALDWNDADFHFNFFNTLDNDEVALEFTWYN